MSQRILGKRRIQQIAKQEAADIFNQTVISVTESVLNNLTNIPEDNNSSDILFRESEIDCHCQCHCHCQIVIS